MKKLSAEDVRRIRKNENDRIRRRNKRFKEATKAEKRVIIAKDVLTQLALGKIKATNGTYLLSDELTEAVDAYDSYVNYGDCDNKEAGETQICDVFKDMKSCKACALGSVFVSAVSIKGQAEGQGFRQEDR
jgi:hypothetical protein